MKFGFGSIKQVGGSGEIALGLGRGSMVVSSMLGYGLFGNVLSWSVNIKIATWRKIYVAISPALMRIWVFSGLGLKGPN